MYWTRFDARSSVSTKTMFGWRSTGSFLSGGALTATAGTLGGRCRAPCPQPATSAVAIASVASAATRRWLTTMRASSFGDDTGIEPLGLERSRINLHWDVAHHLG